MTYKPLADVKDESSSAGIAEVERCRAEASRNTGK